MQGLGIDIGAGSIKVGIFDESGNVLDTHRSPTNADMDNLAFEESLLSALSPFNKKSILDRIDGIGVGSPGPIDSERGIIQGSANLPKLNEFPILEILKEHTGLPGYLNNDANCAALGEYFFGMGKGSPNLFVFTLGTGLGGGWVQNGKLYNGYKGNGMEAGHTTIVKDGSLCGCGNRGCAESYFSAKGFLNRYQYTTGESLDSVASLFTLAESGDRQAMAFILEGTDVLAEATRNIVNLLNIDTVVYVGGLVKSWDLFGERLESRIRKTVFPVLASRLKIHHGENQAILGAGSLVLEEKSN